MSESFRTSDLLEHLDWARALARSLLREDPTAADDAVQDAWLAATRNPPPEKAAIRPWLGTILRRNIGKKKLGDQRRVQRERSFAREEAIEPTSEVVARAAAHRDVVNALLELGEPYKSTLVLRYFEGLGPTAIANRQGIPIDTVRSHLRRGLGKLRAHLDRDSGDPRATRRMLIALASPKLSQIPAPSVGMTATTKFATAALVALVLGAAGYGIYQTSQAPSPASNTLGVGEVDAVGDAATGTESDEPVALRTVSSASEVALARENIGRLLDVNGRPLGALTLRRDGPYTVRWQGGDLGWISNDLEARRLDAGLITRLEQDAVFARTWFDQFEHPDEWRATILGTAIAEREFETAPDGTFAIRADESVSPMRYSSASSEYTLVARGRDEDGVQVWVASRAQTVSGRTLDVEGNALRDAFVSWDFESRPSGFEVLSLVDYAVTSSEVRSESGGTYLLRDVPVSHAVRIRARTEIGTVVERTLVPALASAFDLRFGSGKNLEALELRGIVLDTRGRPAVSASVAVGRMSTKTDARGAFAFAEVSLERATSLTAWQRGFVPAKVADLRRAIFAGLVSPMSIVLQFPGETRVLRGRLVDENGVGVQGASVALDNPTQLETSFMPLEARVGNRQRSVKSSSSGAFELTGLAMRPYRLRVWGNAGVALLVSEPIAASAQDVTLVVDTPIRRRGRAVDTGGEPLAGARVAVSFRTFANASGIGTMREMSNLTRCDGNGDFEIERAPLRFGVVLLEASDGTRSVHPLSGQPREGALLLRHEPGKRFVQVIPPPGLRCDTARFLDDSGGVVTIEAHSKHRVVRADSIDLERRRRPWIGISAKAKTLVLLQGDREVQRCTIPESASVLRGR